MQLFLQIFYTVLCLFFLDTHLHAGPNKNAHKNNRFNPYNQNRKITHTPLVWAIITNNKERVNALINQDTIDELSNGASPLFYAVKQHNFDIACTLLAHGAQPNIETKRKTTPLGFAANRNNPKLVELLIAYGADVNQLSDGAPPLFFSLMNKDISSTEILLKNNADPNIPTKKNISPLSWAINNNDFKAVFLLLKHGAHVNQLSTNNTPLCRASAQGNIKLVNILLEHNADPHIPGLGKTPREWTDYKITQTNNPDIKNIYKNIYHTLKHAEETGNQLYTMWFPHAHNNTPPRL